ncbi:hypothetical protein B4113_1191 [Geobacillus sp. B4113_201601]|nr:hypothetical protein B4113_1191 [Geobacillus sp. B4113_201601]
MERGDRRWKLAAALLLKTKNPSRLRQEGFWGMFYPQLWEGISISCYYKRYTIVFTMSIGKTATEKEGKGNE